MPTLKKITRILFWTPQIAISNKIVSFLVNKIVIPISLIILLIILYFAYISIGETKIAVIGNTKIYADSIELKPDIIRVMDTCMIKLDSANIQINSKTRIYFCSTVTRYNRNTLYLSKGTLGSNNPALNILILAPADYRNNIQQKYTDEFVNRKLSDAIAHELTHTYLKEQLGYFKYMKLAFTQKWKNEGYCEYIANSSSFNIEDGKRIFMENGAEQEKIETANNGLKYGYFYFKSRLKTDYLLSCKKMSFNEFIDTKFDEQVLENEIRNALKDGSYCFDKQ